MTGGQPGHAWLRELNPGYFALVMATGIVSRAAFLDGATVLAAVLLAVAAAAYVVLAAAYGWRFARYRREFLADASDPVKAFAFFTFVAGSNVLGAGLAADHLAPITASLLLIAGLAWLLLGYGIPGTLITRRGAQPALSGANGTWFLWVVGTQSIAVAATAVAATALPASGALAALAVVCWSIGTVLYLIIATLCADRAAAVQCTTRRHHAAVLGVHGRDGHQRAGRRADPAAAAALHRLPQPSSCTALRAGYRRPKVAQDRCPVLSAADRQLYLARPPQRPCR
jgi:tellurite resistance protein TehA-like permease